jgi:hypothetical protein
MHSGEIANNGYGDVVDPPKVASASADHNMDELIEQHRFPHGGFQAELCFYSC